MLYYGATIALSAFLLFLVQPIIAKQILPWFGGSAAVWTTCMVFFQCILLAGYFYSDFLARRLSLKKQVTVHAGLLILSLALLPITASPSFKPIDADNPIGRILLLLFVTIGLPYFMLSTTGPLVQAWFVKRFPESTNPVAGAAKTFNVYRLYALSNVASMAALIAYPPLIEPFASGQLQSWGWSLGYAGFVALAVLTGWVSHKHATQIRARPDAHSPSVQGASIQGQSGASVKSSASVPTGATLGHTKLALNEQLLWLVLAALGSVMLLTVTIHITQNVASVPFLWVLPLAIYLITFILCFDGKGWYLRVWYLPLSALMVAMLMAGLNYRWNSDWTPSDGIGGLFEAGIMHIEQAVPLYAWGLFVLCMVCHGELVARKPATQHLTRFYLMVSLGGAVGGLLCGVVAPLLFSYYWEFPIALLVFALLVAWFSESWVKSLGLASVVACGFFFYNHADHVRKDTVAMDRNFYGTLRIRATAEDTKENAKWRLLHGVITHGEQYRAERFKNLVTTYYGDQSGIGRAILGLREAHGPANPQKVGLIGLGVGTLAAYGRKGDEYRVYELNPQVLDFAQNKFSFLKDSAAKITSALGDARLVLEREADQRFDVLAIDAFSSDSIPVHLITREAIKLYARHVKPEGVIAFHISNRYLDLQPVVAQLGADIGYSALRWLDDPGDESYLYRSDWILVTKSEAFMAWLDKQAAADALTAKPDKDKALHRPDRLKPKPSLEPWTDDRNNLFQILK
jgi:SAM-dependent methyltransferase